MNETTEHTEVIFYRKKGGLKRADGKKKKKKHTKALRHGSRAHTQLGDAVNVLTTTYNTRHRKSSGKKKNGWIREMPNNVFRSANKASKKVKVNKIFKF